MLTGRPPFSGSSSEVLDSHIYQRPPDIETACPDVPKKISKIVRTMMDKKPENRYQTYDALFADMELARQELAPGAAAGGENEKALFYIALQKKIRNLTILLALVSCGLLGALAYIVYMLSGGK